MIKVLIVFLCWCILFVLSWPLALLALVLFPLVWLAVLPFHLIFAVGEGIFAFIKAILFLPARLLGYRKGC